MQFMNQVLPKVMQGATQSPLINPGQNPIVSLMQLGLSNQEAIQHLLNNQSIPRVLGNQELQQQMGSGGLPPQIISTLGQQEAYEAQQGQIQTSEQEQGQSVQEQQESLKQQDKPLPNDNTVKGMHYLVTEKGWEPEFAAAWLGQAVAETGDPGLRNLDVVEEGSGIGRGLFQYSYERRGPYDRARSRAISQGKDVNDINWQIEYALNEDNAGLNFERLHNGLTDPQSNYQFHPKWGTALGVSALGERYKDKFGDANSLMRAYGTDRIGAYTRALTGEYVRPGVIHLEKRDKAARTIYSAYMNWKK